MRKLNEYCSKAFQSLFLSFGMGIRARRTLDEYVSYVNLLTSHAKKDFLEINGFDAQRYFDHLEQEGRLSARTVNARLSCYKGVAKYIVETGAYPSYVNPFDLIRPTAIDGNSINARNIPTMEELDKVMSAAKKLSPMWHLIMVLSSRVCLASTNILRIRRQNILENKGRYFLRFPPTETRHEDMWVALPDDVTGFLLSYVESAPVDEEGHIFFNEHNHPLTLRNMDAAVKKMVKMSGIEGDYTMKDFRSRGILDLAHAGADVDMISSYTGLGHLRIHSFVTAKHLVSGECPAEMVNYRAV